MHRTGLLHFYCRRERNGGTVWATFLGAVIQEGRRGGRGGGRGQEKRREQQLDVAEDHSQVSVPQSGSLLGGPRV